MSNYAIIAEDLTYWYNSLIAVDHINFQVSRGEVLGFLGPNGAGKTTTVKMLIGLLKPKKGKATMLGMDIASQVEKIQSKLGVCFEITNLYEQMSALENLTFFAQLFEVKTFDPYSLLKKVGLSGREKDKVESYSKGMKQRLMVARSLVNSLEILFLDEPTAGLDPVSSEEIRKIILEEKANGVTIFLTTHDMWEADKLSDRVAFIDRGKIVALDTPLSLKQKYGRRALKAKVEDAEGKYQEKEITLDTPETPAAINQLLQNEKIVTLHSEEATLEDIFIKITGRGLV